MKPGGKRPLPERGLSPAPSSPQDAAILKLLGDEDASVVKMVLQQLLADQNQLAAKERLERLLREAASGAAAGELRNALGSLRRGEAGAALRGRCTAGIGSLADLADFYWKASLYHDPEAGPRIAVARVQIAAWGEAVRDGLLSDAPDVERAEALRLVLAEEGGLRGNAERYYDPANSFLDRVVASRRGIPLSLSVLYMLVGEAAGIAVLPVGMPGHFLVRVGARFIDPFHEGMTVGEAALRELLKRSGVAPDEAAWRTPLPWDLVARRMTVNLIHLYGEAGDDEARVRWEAAAGWLGADADP